MVKKKLLTVVLVAVVAGLAWWLALRFRPTPEQRIRGQVLALAECMSKAAEEPTTLMLLKLHALEGLLADQVDVNVRDFPANGTMPREEIISQMTRLRPGFRRIALSFYDVKVELAPPADAAATLTARLAVDSGAGGRHEETRELRCRLKLVDKTWRFTGFEEVTVMQK